MEFEWDVDKAKTNVLKHGVSFEEAKSVFEDPMFVDFYDVVHSETEERFLIVGRSNLSRILIVSYAERNEKYRLISARETTKREREDYEEGNL